MKIDFPNLLTVALALSYVFFVVSLFVSGVGEFINTVILDRRAVLLRKAFETMFGNPAFATALYAHPLVKGQIAQRKKALLEHLPFVRRSGASTATDVEQLPSYVAPPNFSAFVLSLLRDARPGSTPAPLTLDETGQAITAVGATYPELQKLLQALLQGVTDEEGFKARLEAWYTEHMERVSGFFKRETQETLRYVALVIAVLFNIDTIQLTHRLFTEPALAALLASQGETLVEKVDSDDPETSAAVLFRQRRIQAERELDSLKIGPLSELLSEAEKTAHQARLDSHRLKYEQHLAVLNDTTGRKLYRRQVGKLRDLANETIALPVGWGQGVRAEFGEWGFWKFPGWLLTMVAASFGAPFWFDLLGLLVNIRNVGRKPEETKDPGKKPR